MDDRFLDIETKLAYLEDMVDSLNQVIVQQRNEMDQLRDTCRALIERIQAAEDERAGQGSKALLEKPPHY